MTREEAVEILSDMRAEYNIFSDDEEEATRYHALSWAIQALNERTGRWTPVSEGLPKAGECVGNVIKYYLVQNEFGDMLVARYTHSGYWEQIYQYKPCADEIVAWMPLPEPYEEVK